jgi:hypothetical protein
MNSNNTKGKDKKSSDLDEAPKGFFDENHNK